MEKRDIEPMLDTVQAWLSEPNLVSMYVGKKVVGGVETSDWAVVVGVIEKKAKAALAPTDFEIPPEIEMRVPRTDGGFESVLVPTDVIETGEVRENGLNYMERPCPGGFQIQAANAPGWGTLGMNIFWGGKFRMLTCNHVIAGNSGKNLGRIVYQPEVSEWMALAKVSGFEPVRVYPTPNQKDPLPQTARQDIAWCDIDAINRPKFSGLIYDDRNPPGYQPTGYRGPRDGERVWLVGAVTGERAEAEIKSIDGRSVCDQRAGMGGFVYYRDLVILDRHAAGPGDSGAAYVSMEDGMVVALHQADDGHTSYGCRVDLTPAPPLVIAVNPASGMAVGGATVTVTGRGFLGAIAIAVKFGTAAARDPAVVDDTQLTVTSPAANAGDPNPVHVTVTTQNGTSITRTTDQFTYI